jgi:hypothetical protein
MPVLNGYRVAEYLTPVTVAASPVTGPWVETSGFTRIVGWLAVAGGTTVVTIEYGTDGATADADFTPQTVAAGANANFDVLGPYLRFRIVQSVADATKTKLYLQARS